MLQTNFGERTEIETHMGHRELHLVAIRDESKQKIQQRLSRTKAPLITLFTLNKCHR